MESTIKSSISTTSTSLQKQKFCFVCLKVDAMIVSTTVTEDDSMTISEKLIKCVPELTWAENPMSAICWLCRVNLNISYDFRKTCLESNKIIQANSLHLKEEIDENDIKIENYEETEPDSFHVKIENCENSNDCNELEEIDYSADKIEEKPSLLIEDESELPEEYQTIVLDDENNTTENSNQEIEMEKVLKRTTEETEGNLLPTKSKVRYEMAYRTYQSWCATNNVKDLASETSLLHYFGEIAKQKKPSTLWATFSMIKSMLLIEERIDISKHGKLLTFLKRLNVGFKPKKASVFTEQNVEDFLNKAPEQFLPMKVALIIGLSGACKSEELSKMKTNHVSLLDQIISIEIPDTETNQSRSFLIVNQSWVKVIQNYVNLRKHIRNDRFFLQWRSGKAHNQVLGHNSISGIPKKIATFLDLPHKETFSGHAFRRTAATLLANKGGGILNFKRLGGWKSSYVARRYVETPMQN